MLEVVGFGFEVEVLIGGVYFVEEMEVIEVLVITAGALADCLLADEACL